MSNWILHAEYPGEGGGKALPFILSDREKMIIETLYDEGIRYQEIKFVEVQDAIIAPEGTAQVSYHRK